MMPGLWWPDGSGGYRLIHVRAANIAREIATRARSFDFMGILDVLPDPDPILEKMGATAQVLRQIESDAHVFSCMQSRINGTLSKEWVLHEASDESRDAKIAEFVKENLNALDMNRVISGILTAPFYGFSSSEIMWKAKGGNVVIDDIKEKPQEWFCFDSENRLRFITQDNPSGELVPERKFVLVRHMGSYQNPYGKRILSKCFWPFTFKKSSFKYWVIFTEKYGMPWPIGKYGRGASQQEQDALLDKLEAMVQDGVAAISEDTVIEIKEFERRASADIYDKLINACDADISKTILGQTLTTEIGDKGAYAASKTHMEVREDLILSDMALTSAGMNRAIAWLVAFNFADARPPRFGWAQERAIKEAQATRDKTLFDMGVTFPDSYIRETYHIPTPQKGEPVVQNPLLATYEAKAARRRSGHDKVEEMAARSLREAADAFGEEAMDPVMRIIGEASDYDDLKERLKKAFPKLSDKKLSDLFGRAILAAGMYGQHEAIELDGGD